MLEVSGKEMQSFLMDHPGLVAAMCKELGIVDKINVRLFDKFQSKGRVCAGVPGRI